MTRSPECEELGEELSPLLDGELAPERAARVRAHIDGCAHCRAELAALERVDAWLARVPAPAPSEAGLARLRARIATPVAATPLRGRSWSRPFVGAALAAAAALALYLAVARPRAPVAPPQPEPRTAELDLDAAPAEELAVGLELDTAQDLDVIANLDLLEAYVALEERS